MTETNYRNAIEEPVGDADTSRINEAGSPSPLGGKGGRHNYEDGMTEISGFGGEYERSCRTMVKAGLEWFDEHPGADPLFKGYEGVYGILEDHNEDARNLTKAVVGSVDDCTGAMHHATIGHIMHIHEVGWDVYVTEMKEDEEDAEHVPTTA